MHSLHLHKNSLHESGANSAATLEKCPPGEHTARCYRDAAGSWQQPLGEPGAPALEAAVDCEGEGAAPHFCQPQLSTPVAPLQQELGEH